MWWDDSRLDAQVGIVGAALATQLGCSVAFQKDAALAAVVGSLEERGQTPKANYLSASAAIPRKLPSHEGRGQWSEIKRSIRQKGLLLEEWAQAVIEKALLAG